MADRTLVGKVDTWVGNVSPNESHGSGGYLLVQNDGDNTAYGYVFISPPAAVSAGATVESAELVLHVKFASKASETFEAQPLADSFKAKTVTWKTRPSVKTSGAGHTPASASVTDAGPDSIVRLDVTEQLQAVADGAKWYGWRVSLTTASALATVHSANAGGEWRRPRLVVTFSNAPVAPTDLSPSGGRFISTPTPTLRYTFGDYGGNKILNAQRVQISPTKTPATAWDTGMVPTVDPEYVLAGSTYPGLANGDATFWRVKVEDGAGLTSKWSDWAAFERLNKGTLTILNPAADPNDFVTETTPPIVWEHAGPWQQEHWQVVVQQMMPAGWTKIADSGKRYGPTVDAWTVPRGVLTKANWTTGPDNDDWRIRTDYRVVVRTWDGQGREATPGDPAYYQATREFTVREGVTAKVTNLAVTNEAPYPWTRVSWERATAPDKFIIARGGNIVDTVTPDEVLDSGTSYSFLDKRARPNIEHTWTVLPVENGQMSTIETTWVTATVRSAGVWLTTPDRKNRDSVLITGQAGYPDVAMTQEDQGETYEIVGSSRSVRVTNAVKGYTGSVSGILTTYERMLPNVTARDWANRLNEFKSEPDARLLLILSDMVVPIVAYNITTAATPYPDVLNASFEFVQDTAPNYALVD